MGLPGTGVSHHGTLRYTVPGSLYGIKPRRDSTILFVRGPTTAVLPGTGSSHDGTNRDFLSGIRLPRYRTGFVCVYIDGIRISRYPARLLFAGRGCVHEIFLGTAVFGERDVGIYRRCCFVRNPTPTVTPLLWYVRSANCVFCNAVVCEESVADSPRLFHRACNFLRRHHCTGTSGCRRHGCLCRAQQTRGLRRIRPVGKYFGASFIYVTITVVVFRLTMTTLL